jgi:hypothetical protein
MIKQQQAVSLLGSVVKDNTATDLRCVFVGEKEVYNGHRRLYDEMGDCLVRIRADQIERDMCTNSNVLFYYANDQIVDAAGFPGALQDDDTREIVTPQKADELFNKVRSAVNGHYSVLVNPKMICEFIESRTRNNFENFKINMAFLNGASTFLQVVPAEIIQTKSEDGLNGETFVGIVFPSEDIAQKAGASYLQQRDSLTLGLFPIDQRNSIRKIDWKPKMLVKLTDIKIGDNEFQKHAIVLSEYKPGIRIVAQSFPNGLKMLNSPGYTLFQNEDARVYESDIATMPFIRGQEQLSVDFRSCQPIYFDADTLHRALKPMSMFTLVRMDFKDTITGVYLSTATDEWPFVIESILGPANPYVNGRVWTA